MISIIGNFEARDLTGWKEQRFQGQTKYEFVQTEGKHVLMARSSASASGLHKPIQIDLTKTPYLNWSWKIDHVLQGLNESTKRGDDYAARIYVIFQDVGLFLQSRSLTYVWSSGQQMQSAWQSPYSRNSVMIAVQSGSDNTGRWVHQKRDIRDDYRENFGKEQRFADGIALMTDTDNSGQSATAYYGNIFLSER